MIDVENGGSASGADGAGAGDTGLPGLPQVPGEVGGGQVGQVPARVAHAVSHRNSRAAVAVSSLVVEAGITGGDELLSVAGELNSQFATWGNRLFVSYNRFTDFRADDATTTRWLTRLDRVRALL